MEHHLIHAASAAKLLVVRTRIGLSGSWEFTVSLEKDYRYFITRSSSLCVIGYS